MKAVNVMAKKTGERLDQQEKGRQRRTKNKTKNRAVKDKKVDNRKKVVKKPDQSQAGVAAGMFKVRQYLREVVYELRKVVWPSRKETIASTAVVLVIVLICGVFLGVVDFFLNRFVRLLIG